MRDSFSGEVEEANGHVLYHRADRGERWSSLPVDFAHPRVCGLIFRTANSYNCSVSYSWVLHSFYCVTV